jgi:putative membrane protein
VERRTFASVFFFVLALSAIRPVSFFVWFFHALLPIGLFVILACFWRRLAVRNVTRGLVLLQLVLMLIGAHYSFKDSPFLRVTWPGLPERSVLDWVAHFFVAFPIAFVALDVVAGAGVRLNRWSRCMYVLGCCLTPALVWELVEMLASMVTADSFDMTGGCKWDTHIDLGLTLLGGLLCCALPGEAPAGARPTGPKMTSRP